MVMGHSNASNRASLNSPLDMETKGANPATRKTERNPETLNSEGARPEQPLENWAPFPEANGSFRRSAGGVHRLSLV